MTDARAFWAWILCTVVVGVAFTCGLVVAQERADRARARRLETEQAVALTRAERDALRHAEERVSALERELAAVKHAAQNEVSALASVRGLVSFVQTQCGNR